jgi:hypothetical protein
MQLIKTIFDLNLFNGRPLASLVRLTQTISGRLDRILFPLPFGQIKNHTFYLSFVHLISFAKRWSLESGQACPVKRAACFPGVGRTQCLRLSAANCSHYITSQIPYMNLYIENTTYRKHVMNFNGNYTLMSVV